MSLAVRRHLKVSGDRTIRTPRQIQLANAFCRYRELAEVTSLNSRIQPSAARRGNGYAVEGTEAEGSVIPA
jgi:hypothetical protein